jgi:hypothetical protein
MRTIGDNLARQYPENRLKTVSLIPLQERLTGNVQVTLWVLTGAVIVVFADCVRQHCEPPARHSRRRCVLHAHVEGQQRGSRHAVLQARPCRAPERRGVLAATVRRAPASPYGRRGSAYASGEAGGFAHG